jgi:hypothetical protein
MIAHTDALSGIQFETTEWDPTTCTCWKVNKVSEGKFCLYDFGVIETWETNLEMPYLSTEALDELALILYKSSSVKNSSLDLDDSITGFVSISVEDESTEHEKIFTILITIRNKGTVHIRRYTTHEGRIHSYEVLFDEKRPSQTKIVEVPAP